jgi:hypothetical protein
MPVEPHGDPLNPKTAVQTTKYPKRTKNERLTGGTLRTGPVGASVMQNVRQFVYFGYFVVPAALSLGRIRGGGRGEAGSQKPPKATQSHTKAI